ncbi:transposase mutator family protein [Burkholderia pseudomallei]|nr:transposase mutator family protein [Burkholderia pseudomallei]
MTDATVSKKSKNPKAPKLFPDELIDQLLAQVQRGGLTRSDSFLRFLSGTSEAIMLPI